MAVIRQQQFLGQSRIDAPHLRAVESGVAHDFDVLAGAMIAGLVPTVISGFTLIETGAVGNSAESLVLQTAGGSLIHYNAAENGSIFSVPDDRANETLGPTNSKVVGSFTPNSTNFVGVDLVRRADDTTADTVQFFDADTDLETPHNVPLARTLDYRIVVSTTEFSATPGVCPVAKVVTNSANQVVSITDARWLLFRLGAGGSSPQAVSPFGWPGGRNEASAALASVAGDRSIFSLREWMAAVMTRIWEGNGGEYWYSLTADRNVRMASNSVITATGEAFEWTGTNLHWKGLRFIFDNSTAGINEVADQLVNSAGLTDLADGECIYVDVDRTADHTVSGANALTAQKGVLRTLGGSSRPGSRFVVAWRVGSLIYVRDQVYPVGSSRKVATFAANGTVTLSAVPNDVLQPRVAVATGVSGLIMGMSGMSRRGTSTSGDLTIGLGTSEGDQNIGIATTSSTYNTTISGGQRYSTAQKAALKVIQNSAGTFHYDARIVEHASFTDTGSTKVRHYVESGGGVGMANVEVLPETPAPTSLDPARTKMFTRQYPAWKTDVRLHTTGALPACTPAGAGVGKTLTANANGALSVDATAVLINDRILVSSNGVDNGIYKVSDPGSAGTPWILVRATDADSATEYYEGIAVEVTAGATEAGKYYKMTTHPVTIDVTSTVWTRLFNVDTTDQLCMIWWDGSITVVAQSPIYPGA